MSEPNHVWVRDDKRTRNKWHAVEETYRHIDGHTRVDVTACGLIREWYEGIASYEEFVLMKGREPIDRFGVCLTCSRWAEMQSRKAEAAV